MTRKPLQRRSHLPRLLALPGSRIAAVLLLASAALLGESRTYNIEPAPDSRFALEVYKTGLMSGRKHLLVFERYAGRLDYDAGNPEQSKMDLTIESASLVVKDDWVSEKDRAKIADEALRNQLAAGQYPEIRFRSSAIRAAGEGRYEADGDLTIREVTRPVRVRVNSQETAEGAVLLEGEAVVKMKDYKLKPPTAALGLIGTKDEMTVRFQLLAAPAERAKPPDGVK